MDRRTFLAGVAATALTRGTDAMSGTPAALPRAPAVFVSHGAPTVVIEKGPYQERLATAGQSMGGAKAIVVVSAHWQRGVPVRVSRQERTQLIYDFGGFPEAMYRLTYPAPGAPKLADDIVSRLGDSEIPARVEDRGLDHGAWVPLRLMYPDARTPVLQVSLPAGIAPKGLFALGRALRPLREQGVLILGSGGVVHNLRMLSWSAQHGPAVPWARAFDEWVQARLSAGDHEGLFEYEKAPHAGYAVPTTEHFDPLLVTLGAAYDAERAQLLHEGFEYGTLSMRTFAFAG